MKKYRNTSERLLATRTTHSSRKDLAHKFLYSALALSALFSATAFSDEWRPRHALVPHRRAQSRPAGQPHGRIASRARNSRRGRSVEDANESLARGTAPAFALPGHGVRAARAGLDAARVCASPDADLGSYILR